MRVFVTALLLLFTGCAWWMLPTGTDAFQRACRYPKMAQVIDANARQYQGRDCLEYSSDLDLDGHADVRLLYLLGERLADHRTARTRFPYVFIWVGTDGEAYAQQFDLTADGSIDTVSGDIVRLNKILDKINRGRRASQP